MQVYVCKIEAIHPGMPGDSSDEAWFARTTVRTFKISGASYEEVQAQADALVRAYLETNAGIASWTLSLWVRG